MIPDKRPFYPWDEELSENPPKDFYLVLRVVKYDTEENMVMGGKITWNRVVSEYSKACPLSSFRKCHACWNYDICTKFLPFHLLLPDHKSIGPLPFFGVCFNVRSFPKNINVQMSHKLINTLFYLRQHLFKSQIVKILAKHANIENQIIF